MRESSSTPHAFLSDCPTHRAIQPRSDQCLNTTTSGREQPRHVFSVCGVPRDGAVTGYPVYLLTRRFARQG